MIEMEMSKFIPAMHLREAAQTGETILLTQWGKPVAEVKPLPAILESRPIAPPGSGPWADQTDIPDDAIPSWVLLTQDEYEELVKGTKE